MTRETVRGSRAVRLLLRALSLTVACGVLGCQGGAPSPAGAAPTPTRPAGARVELPSGAIYGVELARSNEEMAQGLMYRESLPDRTGMLFLFPDDDSHKFWMKNTLIPLDIIWLDASGRVLFVSANTPPCKADPCPSYGPDLAIASVLEIAGGLAEKEKVTVGSTIQLMDIPR